MMRAIRVMIKANEDEDCLIGEDALDMVCLITASLPEITKKRMYYLYCEMLFYDKYS